jgi:hypothetical protein
MCAAARPISHASQCYSCTSAVYMWATNVFSGVPCEGLQNCKMKCWCLLLAALLSFHSNSADADSVNRNTLALISSYLDENRIAFLVFIDCGAAGEDTVFEFVPYDSGCSVPYDSGCSVPYVSGCSVPYVSGCSVPYVSGCVCTV